jgi:glycosyltransferase 2 family protein
LKSKFGAVIRFTLFFCLGVFFIWLFLRNLSPEQKSEILQSFGEANYWWIGLSVGLGVFAHYLRALRWKMMITPLGYTPGNRNTFFAVMIGYLANLALPRLGEVSRCTILNRYEQVPFNKSFGTVITERALDLFIFLLLFILNLVLQFGKLSEYINEKIYKPIETKLHLSMNISGSLSILVLSAIILLVLFFFLMRKRIASNRYYQKVSSLFTGFLEGIKSLIRIKRIGLFVLYTIAIWCLYLLMAYIIFFSFPESSHLGMDAGLAILVFGTIGIMIVQGGIGIYPAIVAETLFLYAVEPTKGYALGWLIWSSQTITVILLGVLSLILLPILTKDKNHDEASTNSIQDIQSD